MSSFEYKTVLTQAEVLQRQNQMLRKAKALDAQNARAIERRKKEVFVAWKKRVTAASKAKNYEEAREIALELERHKYHWGGIGSINVSDLRTDNALQVAREMTKVTNSPQEKWTISQHGNLPLLYQLMREEFEAQAAKLAEETK